MIKGMTGFGSAEIASGKIRGSVEIKSLNHRYLDIGYFLPTGFGAIEVKIRDLLSQDIERGRVTVAVKITNKPTHTIHFNKHVISTYLHYSKILKKDFGINGQLSVNELMQLPGVIDTRETVLSPEDLWPMIEKGFRKALAELLVMRSREGKSLARDVSSLLRLMSLQINKIQSRARVILREKKKKMTDEEFMSFQKSADVNEEIARLSHHIDEFKLLLQSDIAVGKKLDFIAQEMQRETNTIGSKVQDKFVSNAVIALKSKIEKIREQSQNVE